jgi:thioredoxin reductase
MTSAAASTRDAIVVGGGPAGLSAALVLGRCNRSVLVCDSGKQRNLPSRKLHGFLTRDGVPPEQFLRLARDALAAYPAVEVRRDEVIDASRERNGSFRVKLGDGRVERSRKILLATGLVDELPPVRGIRALYGRSVFHCPYCDGWEVRGRALAAYGRKQRGYVMCRALTAWSDDVALCSDGPCGLSPAQRQDLARNGIRIYEDRIDRLSGSHGQLEAVRFANGRALRRAALFFDTPTHGRSDLAQRLGCEFRKDGGLRCSSYEASSIPGVYVAGNIIRDVQLVAVAAAEGAKAAFGINLALTREAFEQRSRRAA